MSLSEKFFSVRNTFDEIVSKFLETVAGYFGYPENPGMATLPDGVDSTYYRSQFFSKLPVHQTSWPPIQRPGTFFETIFGSLPKLEKIPRYFYATKEEGFYNFYIENYSNSYFLPDWLSEFLQIQFNICLDIKVLETIREVIFVGLMIYTQILIFRIALAWFISINPYNYPWCYIAAAVDWTEDLLQGIIPAILGINLTGTIFLGLLGFIADSLNHLVFTMPFLPSEGQEGEVFINNQKRDVLIFHYLPALWYEQPIPNEIREFWYNKRPDILQYFLREYNEKEINFLPNSVLRETLRKSFPNSLLVLNTDFLDNHFDSTTDVNTEIHTSIFTWLSNIGHTQIL